MQRNTFLLTAFFGFCAVALGAFGAHGLKDLVSDYQLTIWEKAVHYQFFHTLVLLFLHLWQKQNISATKTWAIRSFIAGIGCFSGSLYLLATKDIIGVTGTILGPITPVGGLFFLIGWGLTMKAGMEENL